VDIHKDLGQGVLGHWVQSLGGTGMATIALVAEINNWTIPPWVWLSLSAVLFLGAIIQTFHEIRLERDEARDALTDKRNFQGIADSLTEKYNQAIQRLWRLSPALDAQRNEEFDAEFREWLDAVKVWANDVLASMQKLGCSAQELSRFSTVDELKPGMMVHGDRWEVGQRLHETRVSRLWSIIESYAQRAEKSKL
jgi:hypothetical protein